MTKEISSDNQSGSPKKGMGKKHKPPWKSRKKPSSSKPKSGGVQGTTETQSPSQSNSAPKSSRGPKPKTSGNQKPRREKGGQNQQSGRKKQGSQRKGRNQRRSKKHDNSENNMHVEVTIKGSSRTQSNEQIELINYGQVDEGGTFDASTLEKYETPRSIENPDPWGDDLFADLKKGYIPSAPNVEIWTMLKWGIPSKSSWFPKSNALFKTGEKLLVETEKGLFIGEVVKKSILKNDSGAKSPRKIIRNVTQKDTDRLRRHQVLADEAFLYAKQKINKHKLAMKLFNVHILHTGDKILFYFTAENRIDFRQLVRELAAKFSMRIEMRQMGVRDDAKTLGGLGPCGQVLCCANHLNRFIPVSIRMAKDQNLVLKPQNVSGQCGRLKCCLAYEQDYYKKLRKNLPRNGKRIETPKGFGKVINVNLLKEEIKVLLESGGVEFFSRKELQLDKSDKPDKLDKSAIAKQNPKKPPKGE